MASYYESGPITSIPGALLSLFAAALLVAGLARGGWALLLSLVGFLVLADCALSNRRAEQHHGTIMVAGIFGGIIEAVLLAARLDAILIILAFLGLVLFYLAQRVHPFLKARTHTKAPEPAADHSAT